MATAINKKQAVANLQKHLKQISHTDNDLPTVPVDGIYESQTKDAVMAFQEKYGLPVTGTVDRRTWDAIYNIYRESIEENSPPASISPFPRNSKEYSLGPGDKQFLVSLLQHMLSELSRSYKNNEVPLTGVYDNETESAVKSFQQAHGLEQSGKVDKKTWNALANAYNRTTSDYTQ